jgi:hypothetical protein
MRAMPGKAQLSRLEADRWKYCVVLIADAATNRAPDSILCNAIGSPHSGHRS